MRLAILGLLLAVQSAGQQTEWLGASGSRIKARVYKGSNAKPRALLAVVLHGDAPFNNPTYQYDFAGKLAARFPEIVAAALLRPGYANGTGDRSEGVCGKTTGDNYTPEVLEALKAATKQLKSELEPSAVMLVGHSGGAVLSADLLGRDPGLAKAALLVSCPCDVQAWRRHMKEVSPTPLWNLPVSSISPLDTVSGVSRSVLVGMVVGEKDPVAPAVFTEKYAAALKQRGVPVEVTKIAGAGHEIFLRDEVLQAFQRMESLVLSSRDERQRR